MKKLYFILLSVMFMLPLAMRAQVLPDYSFTAVSGGTYTALDASLTTALSLGDDAYEQVTLPFNFKFGENWYTTISVCSNGYLSLGSTSNSTSPSFTSTSVSSISPLGHDLTPNEGGTVSYATEGTTPNRVFTVQWAGVPAYNSSNTYEFQVKLYETTNAIEFCYGNINIIDSKSPYVGLYDHTTGEKLVVQGTGDWSQFTASSITTTNTVSISSTSYPTSGLVYSFIPPVVTCPRPNGLTFDNATTTSIAFHFNPALETDNAWQAVILAPSDTAIDESQAVALSSTSYEFMGLNAETTYRIYVRTDCGGDYSAWSVVLKARTECNEFMTIPYTENFDDYGTGTASTSFPQCWNRLTNYTTQYPYISSSSAYTAPGNLYFYSTSSYYSMAIAPEIDTVNYPINTLTVNFLIRKTSTATSYGAIQIGVMTDPTDASTFTPVASYTGSELSQTNQWYEIEVALSNYTGYGSYIALRKPMDASTGTNTYIDNFRIYPSPTCLKPVNVAVSNVTDNSAELAWVSRSSESEWQVVVVPHGEEMSTGTPENVYDMPYTLTNLTDNTQYDVYVKAICGGGDESEWSNMRTFTTRCLPTSVIPFEEDFSTYGTGSTAFPDCWVRHREGTTTAYPYVSTSYGAGSLYFYSSSTVYSYAASQALDLTGENPGSLVFSWDAYSSSTSYGRLDVGYMTDADDINTFVRLKSIYLNDLQPVSNWYNFSVVLPEDAYQHQNIYLAFYAPSRESNYVYIDNVKVDYTPTCSDPTNLTVSNVAGSSALVSWTEGQFGTPDYNVEYSEAGQDNWTSVTVSGETSVMLTGLSELTAYDVRVSVDCPDVTVPSYITNSFVTLCNAGGAVNFEGGTATSYYVPLNNYFNYTYTQQIFLASEMGGATTINSVAFDYAYATASSSKSNVDIYLKHTSKNSFSSTTDYEPITGAQLVYSGNLNCQQGWNTFTFTTPFQYNGVDNLMLIVDDNSGSYNGSSYVFHVEAQSASRSLYYYSDSANPDPSDPTAAGAKIQLLMQTEAMFASAVIATAWQPVLLQTYM